MKFENDDIIEFDELLTPRENAVLIDEIFRCKPLWEKRSDRIPAYKNAEWHTMGANIYLDLKSADDWKMFQEKTRYFNSILYAQFKVFFQLLFERMTERSEEKFELGWRYNPCLASPGFHIFPPHMAGAEFFGHKHKDLQWKALEQFPGVCNGVTPDLNPGFTEHFSGTYCVTIPKQGPHFLYGEELEKGLTYNERSLYLHSGQFTHAIAPLQRPVTFLDWRVSLQFHGFKLNGVNWLYW